MRIHESRGPESSSLEQIMRSQRGFTLIELLTVVGILGILAYLGLTSFYVYRSDAAYAVVTETVAQSVTALEAGGANPDELLPTVTAFTQASQGPLTNSDAAKILPGLRVPRRTKFFFDHDPSCTTSLCEQTSIEVRHCLGQDFVRYVRYGDGADVRLEHIAGVGCS